MSESLVNRRELAALLGVHPETVSTWLLDANMPVAERGGRGKAHKFLVSAVRTWLATRAATVTTDNAVLVKARARREDAAAKLAEQAYSIKAGEWIRQSEVDKAWAAEVGAVKTIIRNMPRLYGDRVLAAALSGGIVAVRTVLHEAGKEILTQLSNPARQIAEGVA